MATDFGPPLAEIALEFEIGNCLICDREADDVGGGALHNVQIGDDGVVRGDSVCVDCMEQEDSDWLNSLVAEIRG